ncbi:MULTISPECIES: LolA family protein [unclassified Capnocytophaga]|uniref:LolA family protein n=1 Tax=unclassified Capnocytophaga TaxID=2640652 RepID=UPI0002E74480|nr:MULTISPECIES: outer membrane lipoprotein carrier protein LolA [unclassified Capnocytophaga]MEB3004141.1 outer membrane lipoprotein carrier protein LolA [Capnocytophaga sp. G2]
MKYGYLFFGLIMTTLLWGQEKALTQAQITAFKAKVIEKNATIETLQADFKQRKHLEFMSKDIETKGKMAFLKPDQLNWQYTTPYRYQIVFQRDNIKVNDEGKVSQMKADNKIFKKINKLIVSSVSGNMFDDKEFAIILYTSGNETLAKFSPKDRTLQKYIKEIHLFFSSDATVGRVKLIEPTEDYTEIIFMNKKLNTPIDASVFNI